MNIATGKEEFKDLDQNLQSMLWQAKGFPKGEKPKIERRCFCTFQILKGQEKMNFLSHENLRQSTGFTTFKKTVMVRDSPFNYQVAPAKFL